MCSTVKDWWIFKISVIYIQFCNNWKYSTYLNQNINFVTENYRETAPRFVKIFNKPASQAIGSEFNLHRIIPDKLNYKNETKTNQGQVTRENVLFTFFVRYLETSNQLYILVTKMASENDIPGK